MRRDNAAMLPYRSKNGRPRNNPTKRLLQLPASGTTEESQAEETQQTNSDDKNRFLRGKWKGASDAVLDVPELKYHAGCGRDLGRVCVAVRVLAG
jgi:hypothetical protein